MHLKAKMRLSLEKETKKQQRAEARTKKMEELKQKIEETKEKKEKKASGELKEPPMMDTVMNFLGGFKLEIKRIHIRYEDDYFQHHNPFSMGLMIDSISLDNSDCDWTFESALSIMLTKKHPV
jgi:Vacuolar sorting-associated protein 13, N-terminal